MSLCKIKLSDIKKIDFIITKGMTANQIYEKYKPDYMINAALYDISTHSNITNAKDEGIDNGYLFTNEGIAINKNNSLSWSTKEKAEKDFIAGSPTLVKDGKSYIQWGNKYSSYVDGVHRRSVLGFNNNELFLYCSDEDLSINNTVSKCISLGMKYAINLDGGGSCHLQKGTIKYKASSRANCSWILVYLKNEEKIMTSSNKKNITATTVNVICNNKQQEGLLINGVTYVPVRFIAENLEAVVNWNQKTNTVTIKK